MNSEMDLRLRYLDALSRYKQAKLRVDAIEKQLKAVATAIVRTPAVVANSEARMEAFDNWPTVPDLRSACSDLKAGFDASHDLWRQMPKEQHEGLERPATHLGRTW